MIWKILFLLYISWINNSIVLTQNSIGLRVSAALRGLQLGTAILVENIQKDVDNGNYTSNLKKNYQLVVPEMGLKPQQIWSSENIYNWTVPDWLVGSTPNSTGWVQQNGMQILPHILIWAGDQHLPGWLLQQESSMSPDKAKQLLSDYIHTVVGRYRGKMAWWTVMNEAIDDMNNTNTFNLRNCLWYRKLGVDFMKYAFIFAHEADPDAQLYYNEYGIESLGLKSNRTLELLIWLRSQGVTVHGVGLQWHIYVGKNITPGDAHYQSVQQFVDNGFDFMVTELDVAVPMKDGKPIYPNDIARQGLVYRALLQYVLHFFPKCRILLTWGFTDRYNWIPAYTNYTAGDALPLDLFYQPKPAYLQLQEELARTLTDGVYCLSPQSQPNKYLGISNETKDAVQLYDGSCNNANEKWNITWLDDGTYRLSPISNNSQALYIYNATATVGEVQMSNWSHNVGQEWVFTSQGNNIYRVGPRNAWSRVMTVYDTTNIAVVDYSSSSNQNWILTSVS